MSLKPPKKSDMGKNWMKPRRDKVIKMSPEYHLIVTEGEKTEPFYFDAIKEIVNEKFGQKIHLDVKGVGNNTLNLLERARKLAANNPNVYRHVWIVYDTDDFPAEHINRTSALCQAITTPETTYHAIWSNQCIEVWFLLHFSYFQSDIHRSAYWPKLTAWLTSLGAGTYTKGRMDIYEVLSPFMDYAISNAEKLEIVNQNRTPSASAPGTRVHALVKVLRPYL